MKSSQIKQKAVEKDCNNIVASSECNSEYLNDFLVETKEHLEKIELNSLMLEKDSANKDLIDCIFRDFHTIKGLAGFVSQTLIQKIAHQTESVFDRLRRGEIPFDIEISDIIQKSAGFISGICNDLTLSQNSRFVADINTHLLHMSEIHSKIRVDNNAVASSHRISIENYEFSPLRAFKKVNNSVNSIDVIKEIIAKTGSDSNPISYKNVMKSDVNISNENTKMNRNIDTSDNYNNDNSSIPNMTRDCNINTSGKVINTDMGSSNSKISNSFMLPGDSDETLYVRIPMKKIDALIGVIGELIISHSQFEQYALSVSDSTDKLNSNLHRVNILTRDIQNIAMSLRMVSLKTLFQRIYRIGIDTVDKLGKNVEITISGEDTEIDRNVVEKLVDPLIHLINNSIYHGVEDKIERIKSGKPPIGNVRINASSKKGIIYIEVTDDGRGIDTKKVLKKAISKNLVVPSNEYTDHEVLDLIFLPGFSTLEKADDISGRGVGLDVVKTEIVKIGGKVEISNNFGKGCSFTLQLPVNMTIIKGTIVEVSGAEYIVPLIYINAFAKCESDQWISAAGSAKMFRHRNELIPVIDIAKTFGQTFSESNSISKPNASSSDINEIANSSIIPSQVLILESGNNRKALPVDRIVENRDIIVKSLGSDFANLSYAFGASILGNGKIAIILDVESFFAKECD
jgi:two-component system, chemotaxis family, sensor kinase CheA